MSLQIVRKAIAVFVAKVAKNSRSGQPALVLVYNADGGMFNRLTDLVHKVMSPETYPCRLCMLTHAPVGMRDAWKRFISELGYPVEFYHRDEWRKMADHPDVPLPAVFWRENGRLRLCVPADAIRACRSVEALKQLILQQINTDRQEGEKP